MLLVCLACYLIILVRLTIIHAARDLAFSRDASKDFKSLFTLLASGFQNRFFHFRKMSCWSGFCLVFPQIKSWLPIILKSGKSNYRQWAAIDFDECQGGGDGSYKNR